MADDNLGRARQAGSLPGGGGRPAQTGRRVGVGVVSIDLTGVVAVVTGGTRGIGRAVAEAFLHHGAAVVVCGRHEPEAGPPAVGGRQATFVAADVRQPAQAEALVAAVVERHGRLDVLVNNAGGSPPTPAEEASPRFVEAIVALNLLGPFHCARAAVHVMRAQEGGGSIVNIGSVSGTRPSPGTALYGAAKAGLANLTRTLAMEWAPEVRVNAVVPGLVVTDEGEDHYGGPAGLARVARTVPMGRMVDPQEVADACLFLVSPLASAVTGALLSIDGGGEWPPHLAAAAGEPGPEGHLA